MMKLDKKYWLESDKISYIIGVIKKDKVTGADKFSGQYHYGTCAAFLKGYKELKIRQGISEEHLKTLDDIKDLLVKLDSHIETIVGRIQDGS